MIRSLVNFVLFQAGWAACVLGAARGHAGLGPACVAIIIAVHLAWQRPRRPEMALIASSAGLGALLDSVLVAAGLLSFESPAAAPWLCPLWIVALWANFGTTLNSSLGWLRGRPALAAILGAAGGPLAYWAGARLGAVDFGPRPVAGLAAVAAEWAAALALLVLAARRWCTIPVSEHPSRLASTGAPLMPRALLVTLLGWGVMAAVMAVLWVVQRRRGDAGIVDVAWAAGLGFFALLYAATLDGYAPRRWLVAGVVCVWSGRLALYLLVDRVLRGEEDGRYRMLRERWGPQANRNFFLFFQAQATWDVLFAVPVLAAMLNARPQLAWPDWVGLAVAIVAIAGESLADRQLARFRADPDNRGRTCRSGLWRYSRHPNYFFEWLHWWAYVGLAASGTWWWLSLLGPVVMLLFLFKLTGIPYTEARALHSRGEDYRRYQHSTSAFFPWFPSEERPT